MSEAATMESPPVNPASTVVTDAPIDQSFKDIMGTPENAPPKEFKKNSAPLQKETKDHLKEKASKQDKQPEQKQQEQKSGKRWDSIDDLKGGDDAAESDQTADDTQSTEENEEAPKDEKANSRWKQLREYEKSVTRAASIDDIVKIPNLPEKVKEEIESLKAKAAATAPNEEKLQRLEHLEQVHAESLLEENPDYIRDVAGPIKKNMSLIGEAAKKAGLDAVNTEALLNATDDPNIFNRMEAIRSIISKGVGADDVPISEDRAKMLADAVIGAANTLHETAYPASVHYRNQARQIAAASQGKETQQTAAQRQEQEAVFTKAREEVGSILKEKMPLLFEKHPEALEAIKTAVNSEEPSDRAYEAMSGHLLTYAAKTINSLKDELRTARAQLKAREGAKPRSGDSGGSSQPKQSNEGPSFNEVFGQGRM